MKRLTAMAVSFLHTNAVIKFFYTVYCEKGIQKPIPMLCQIGKIKSFC